MMDNPSRTLGVIEPNELLAAADSLRRGGRALLDECRKVIVGQDDVLEQLLLAILARGHCLLVGVPGLAKTLMIRTLADGLDLAFNRVQFTPDLMPSDITGTELLQGDAATGERAFRFVKGPLFANIVLADEINRTPPKTQAALLEAMQERQITVAGVRHVLPEPFFVLATQNPIEQEGTYPLPEAQQDRFLFSIRVDYPNEADECRIIEATTSPTPAKVSTVLAAADVLRMQAVVREVPAADFVIQYAARLTRLTRPAEPAAPDFVRNYITWGAGPRAGQSLILAAKARAVLHGRPYVALDDVRAVAAPVLRHRILTNYSAEADRIKADDLIAKLLAAMPKDGAV
jgi:MoxR-like ATPase